LITPLRHSSFQAFQWVQAFLFFILAVTLFFFVWWTWHWPLVGDASLMHYVVFLMGHGFSPYRQIVEFNMPGSYLVEWVLIHIFGGSSLGWRIFDFTLMGVIGAAMIVIARPYGWFAGFAPAVLLTLIHGQDGVAFLGERDLIITGLLACSYACAFVALRRNSTWLVFFAALAAGIASTMKPVVVPAGFLFLVLVILRWKFLYGPFALPALYGAAGLMLPPLGVFLYLVRVDAVGAFYTTMTGLARYYNGMYHKPLGFLVAHSVSPIGPLVILWLLLLVFQREWNWEKWMLLGGIAFGLAAYCVQARGFQYYRYPLLMFLLLLMGIDFQSAFRHRTLRYVAAAGSAYALLILAPQSAWKAVHYDWRNQEFITMLSGDLERLGGPQLNGNVQCLDTIAGCINTLYRMSLVQATGYFYDCYAYAPRGTQMIGTVESYRRGFLAALERTRPRVLVVSNQYCQGGLDSYGKLQRWPALDHLISEQYQLYVDRMPPHNVYWWSRSLRPSGYRIYLRREP
jgi:hypothetical protein